MANYSLLTYDADGGPRAGLLVNDHVLDLAAAAQRPGHASVLAVLESWAENRPFLQAIADAYAANPGGLFAATAQPLSSTRLRAPILYPGAIFCVAANYVDHMMEMTGRTPPDKATARPYFFLKMARHTVIGPDEPIPFPTTSSQLDWEAEIGVVIGRTANHVREDEALEYVAGYTIVNDLSIRDLTRRTDWNFGNDWFRGKCFDGSAPLGPWIVPADRIANPQDLAIKLWVNDDLMQDSSSRNMHFTIAEQIAYLTEQVTLYPGDVIATGTPAGVGRPRGIYLKPGDHVAIEIEGLGTLRNQVVPSAVPVAV